MGHGIAAGNSGNGQGVSTMTQTESVGGSAHFSPGCSCQHRDAGQKAGLPSAPLEGWQWRNVGR
jgi:hypothetical protein